ncbi:hypothetical protein NARC_200052 [Candidatus Nitrosocosmicus arcticus]|uniref:Transcription factor zinc-finger domain-containing protein n=1 Tax=Candidatus Nitrosocosmicus arcticus TaxID=2035267 RepID=A0A557SRD7_9ARCH|nr:hypothetical protein NARC_200052 [Candidatus Nitrosocosmicus arcticus]
MINRIFIYIINENLLYILKSPICFSEMVLTSRFCVELDKCLGCEGIWLDCGEIEKITDNNKIGNELHEEINWKKTMIVMVKIRVFIFTRPTIVKMPLVTRCSILNNQD